MRVHFSSQRMDWKTPKAVYQVLDAEFRFDHDPCPPDYKVDGLTSDWGGRTSLTLHMVKSCLSGLQRDTKNGGRAKPWSFSYRVVPTHEPGTTTA